MKRLRFHLGWWIMGLGAFIMPLEARPKWSCNRSFLDLGSRTGTTMQFSEYAGMSYERASREAAMLIVQVGWFHSWDRLIALRKIMERERGSAK